MMRDSDQYYRRRLAEELAAADRASCAKAEAAHRELAKIYRLLVGEEDGPTVVLLRPELSPPAS